MKKIIYRWIRRKQDTLKRNTDRRYSGLWMGAAPELLKAEELQPGDVLFCGQVSQDKFTEVIKCTTDGVYVHCGVYIGNNTVVDVLRSGIREVQLELFVEGYTYIAVTRCPGSNEKRSEVIVEFARRCVRAGVRYNHLSALLVPLREYLNVRERYSLPFRRRRQALTKLRKSSSGRRSYFCSEFVVQCFIECDYIDENQDYHQPKYWSPTGLAEENIFTLVGFMSTGGLAAVHPDDPHISGSAWVLTETGRKRLQESQLRMDAQVAELLLKAAKE